MNATDYEKLGQLYLGRRVERDAPYLYDSRDLTTHALCVGMTGSGKTGLCIGLLEEALIDGIGAIAIDPKGDISNIALTFPGLEPEAFREWIDPAAAARAGMTVDDFAAAEADRWRVGLAGDGQPVERVGRLADAAQVRLYTPGSSAGRGVSILGSLAAPPASLVEDIEGFSERVGGTATSLLALLDIDGDPLQSVEHVFLSNLLSHFWREGRDLDLAALIRAIQKPPFDRIGVLGLDEVMSAKQRTTLAARMNNLLAAPSFAPWLAGEELDVGALLAAPDGKPRLSVFSIAHLSDAERMFFVSLLLNRVVDWVRDQSGTSSLRALLYMDEVFGYLPPVANPPSKQPLLTLLKQARAHGFGTVLATQNPADVDYKAVSNAGTWFLGRLQTERDVDRVMDGLVAAEQSGHLDAAGIRDLLAGLKSRQFLVHNVHEPGPEVIQTRWVLSYLRGPMTREDIRRIESAAEPEPTGIEHAPVIAEPGPVPAQTVDAIAQRYHAVTAPGQDEELVWRPMAYLTGVAHVSDGRRKIAETVEFGWVHGLQGDPRTLDWRTAHEFRAGGHLLHESAPVPGRHLDVAPAVHDAACWDDWRERAIEHAVATVRGRAFRCARLRLSSEPGESESAFRQRVSLALREKRDAAVDKLRDRYQRKLDSLEDRLERARDKVETQADQARAAELNAAVSAGQMLWGMFGGRRRGRAVASKATRVVKERRDVERAQEDVAKVLDDIAELSAQMQAAVAEEASEFDAEQYPIEVLEAAPSPDEVTVEQLALLWIPYWVDSHGNRRRAF